MNPLKRGLAALSIIKKKKKSFLFLVLLQILLLVLIFGAGIKYQIRIYEDIKGVVEPLEEINYSELEKVKTKEELSKPMMTEMMKKMASAAENYESMIKNFLEMIAVITAIFLAFNGFIWSKANCLLKKGKLMDYWRNFAAINLVFLAPFGLLSYLILRSLIGKDLELFGLTAKALSMIFLAICYLMIVGFCLPEERLNNLLKKIFLIGAGKIHWVMLGLTIVLLGILLSLLLAYFAIGNLFLMILSAVLAGVVMVGGKFFMIGIIMELKVNEDINKAN